MSEYLVGEKYQPPSTVWPFELDPVHHWAYWEEGFSKEECQKIIDIGNELPLKKAVTRGNAEGLRESQASWIYPSEDTRWIYERVTGVVSDLNSKFFGFDLFGATEGFQFTKYAAPGGKYGKHTDSAPNSLIRKLSFTLQLSEPEDYEGGDLCLYLGEEPERIKKARGYIAVFPSYVLHEVEPVTKGTRYSLVSWITGKPFR